MNKFIKGAFVVSAFIIGLTPFTFAKFTDLIEIGDYTKAIESLVQKGVIKGYPDNTFRPSGKITRAEFVKMIVTNENLKANAAAVNRFSDVENHWAKEFIDIAYANHVIKGYEDNSFKPDKEISYAEVSSILLNLLDVELDSSLSWHDACINGAEELGLLNGVATNDLLAVNPARRDNVALMLYNKSKVTSEENNNESEKDDSAREEIKINTRELHLAIVKEELTQNSEYYYIVENVDGEEEKIKLYSKSSKPQINSFIVYTLTSNGEMRLRKQLLKEEVDDIAFIVESMDDGLAMFKNEKRLFDISADEYKTENVEIELKHYTFYTVEMKLNKNNEYEFIDIEKIEKDDVRLEKKDRICFDEQTEIALIIKGIEE